MPHVLIKYAHVLICISEGDGSWYFSAFHLVGNQELKPLVSLPDYPIHVPTVHGVLKHCGGIYYIPVLYTVHKTCT